MAVTPNLGLSSPLASLVTGWIARIKGDFLRIEGAMRSAQYNQLVNPGLEFWSMGLGPFTADALYAADGWAPSLGAGAAISVTGLTPSSVFLSIYKAHLVYTHAGAASVFRQKMQSPLRFRGATLVFGAYVAASVPNGARLYVYDGITTTYSAYHSGAAGFEQLTVLKTPDVAATTLQVGLEMDASGTYELDSTALVMGSVLVPPYTLDPTEDRMRAEALREVHGAVAAGGPQVAGYASAGSQAIGLWVPFRTRKAAIPTVTKQGTWAVTNCGQPVVAAATADGYLLQVTSSAAGRVLAYPDSTDDLVLAEAYP